MQLLLVRHALPASQRTRPGFSDPHLSDEGVEQAKRLPDAFGAFPDHSNWFSSPADQVRSDRAARLSERPGPYPSRSTERASPSYDPATWSTHIPIEQIARRVSPRSWSDWRMGTPAQQCVDEAAVSWLRINAGISRPGWHTGDHEDTVGGVSAHGGG